MHSTFKFEFLGLAKDAVHALEAALHQKTQLHWAAIMSDKFLQDG